MRTKTQIWSLMLLVAFCADAAKAAQIKVDNDQLQVIPRANAYPEPLTTDSRVKIYTYSPHEIFPINIHYGYQSYIEFGKDEEITTVALGNSYAWNINKIKNRLFIKPMEADIKTNMVIITDKRVYNFDISSQHLTKENEGELAYVVKFVHLKPAVNR